MLAPGLYVRETEDCDTPASRATSVEEAYLGMLEKGLLVSFLTLTGGYD